MSSTPPGDVTEPSSPRRPTDSDIELLSLAQQLELTARDLYSAAVDAKAGDDAQRAVLATLRENHEAYATTLAGLLGVGAPSERDDATFEELVESFSSDDATEVANAGYDLESRLVATHIDFVAQFESTDAARVVTSLLLVESQHCTVLADLAGKGDDLSALLDNPALSSPASGTATSSTAP